MKRGFFTIMGAQFFSSLADNALFAAAVELLKTTDQPEWQRAALVPIFALFYVIFAPMLGVLADAIPKGRVMFISNLIKIAGCLMMLFGSFPLVAYSIVGLGAAAYSPAKYGILTELLPTSQLVKANSWVEGLTIASIILGVILGGLMMQPAATASMLAVALPYLNISHMGIDSAPEVAIGLIAWLYVIAALFNLRIPRTQAILEPMTLNVRTLVQDFAQCNARLWTDKLGQISLSATTLIWGVGSNLKYIVLAWAAASLGYDISKASALTGIVAVGMALGAVLASMKARVDQAPKVLPLGILMGLAVVAMNAISSVWVAAPFLIFLGLIGGYMVVPMNALLQHRGHNLMGAGRSIAVQNFNEQACILLLGAFYTGMTKLNFSVDVAITVFGLFVAATMWLIMRWHARNCVVHHAEVQRLLNIAGHDQP
jgi:MFS transporter, LPLT family, lysophospholipid transporter